MNKEYFRGMVRGVACILGAAALFWGAVHFGWLTSRDSVIRQCTSMGAFVSGDQVFTCAPRKAAP